MKKFKKAEIQELEAVQFDNTQKEQEYAQLCWSRNNIIRAVPSDLLGTPRDAFYAVQTAQGWQTIQNTDWIVKKDNELLVVPDSVMRLFFVEI